MRLQATTAKRVVIRSDRSVQWVLIMLFFKTSTARMIFCLLWCLSWPVIIALLLRPLPFSLPGRTDIVGHFLLFGTMSLAIFLFARSETQIKTLAAVTIIFGVALEVGQAYVPSRYFDVADIIANIVGGFCGGLLACRIFRSWMVPSIQEVSP